MNFDHEIFREFSFEAAHRLPNVPAGHKCERLHGHSYRVTVHVAGNLGETSGWIQDFGEIKSAWNSIDQQLDHRYLNEVPGLENPTSEIIAEWIFRNLSKNLRLLSAITVRETCTAGCTYRPRSG